MAFALKHFARQRSLRLAFHSINKKNIHLSITNCDLMEFFEDKKNWGKQEIKCGRAWTVDELRIKSNFDLHKLWYVLYKEKNMLLTMEEAAKEATEYFPSPERIDKVEISMENLESVVRERNEAYSLLETGEIAERPHDYKEDEFGRFNKVPLDEHLIPMEENTEYLEKGLFPVIETVNPSVPEFHCLLKEKENLKIRMKKRFERGHIYKLFRAFPDLDMEALQEEYPDHDVYSVRKYYEKHYVEKEYSRR